MSLRSEQPHIYVIYSHELALDAKSIPSSVHKRFFLCRYTCVNARPHCLFPQRAPFLFH